MKKLFISQPMRGKTDEEILAERADAVQAARDALGEEVEVIDSFFGTSDMSHALEYLGESLKLLSKADTAYFAPGWRDARGCKIEHACADAYGIHHIEAWSPKEVFDEAYRPTDAMTFGLAIEAMKAGKKVARAGWNGKNQHIELASCISYKSPEGQLVNADHDAIGNQAVAFCGTSGVQMGWLASQADMLAEDWRIVE